jgi:hypothetical protein
LPYEKEQTEKKKNIYAEKERKKEKINKEEEILYRTAVFGILGVLLYSHRPEQSSWLVIQQRFSLFCSHSVYGSSIFYGIYAYYGGVAVHVTTCFSSTSSFFGPLALFVFLSRSFILPDRYPRDDKTSRSGVPP